VSIKQLVNEQARASVVKPTRLELASARSHNHTKPKADMSDAIIKANAVDAVQLNTHILGKRGNSFTEAVWCYN